MDRLRQKEVVRNRRRKRKLIRERVRKYMKNEWFESSEEFISRELQMIDSRPRCSCMICGNPRRKYKKITLQEKKFLDCMKDQCE